MTWSSPPSELRFTAPGTLYLHYVRTIAAGGTVPISHTLATDGPQANVDALSADARSAVLPSVAITSPADGTSLTAASVTVTGTTSDEGPVSVQVNGQAATVAADRTWSATVPLAPGANTLTATATDADGNTATARRTVTLATTAPLPSPQPQPQPKPQPRPAVSNQFTLTAAQAKNRRSVKLTLRLPGPGLVRATLRRTTGTGTLATARKTATKAGQVTLTLRLSKSALKALRRSRTLKARVAVTFTPTGGVALTKAKRLTLRSP